MKHTTTKGMFKITLLLAILVTSLSGLSQDTLHLVYHHTQVKPHDSTEAKIDKWVKSLNGKHMDIVVVSYYHKLEFKKFSQERCDELFLVLNRKARALITIESIGPKKGTDAQRTTVDIIYKPTVTPEQLAAQKKAEEEKEKEKAEAAKKKENEKSAKESDKKAKDKDSEKKSKSEVAAAQTEKGTKEEKDKKESKGKDSDKKGKDTEKKGKDNDDDEDDGNYGQASSRTFGEGSSMTLQELKYVKSAKFIVAQTGRKSLDTKLNDAVKDFWNFTPNVVQMPYDEARKLGKENKKDTMVIFSFIQVRTWFTEKHGPVTIKILRVGYALSIETGKGKILVKQFIPKLKGEEPSYVHFAFGVTCLNDLCHMMNDNNLAKSPKTDEFIDLRTPELKGKTLIISESQLNKNLPREEIPLYYSAPYRIVSDKEWEEAILQKKDFAYAMVVLFPINPKHFFHYIIDAKTGRTYFIDLNSKFSFSAGFGTNFDPTQSGFIDKSNFQRYDKGINNAIKDNENRAEDHAKDAEKEKKKADAEAEKKAKKEEAKKKKEEEDKKKKEEKEGKK